MRLNSKLCAWLGLLACCVGGSALAEPLRLYTEEYRPLSYMDQGKLTGMAVDVVELLIQRTGQAVTVQVVPWTRGYQRVQQEANSALFTVVRTAKREALFQWVGPITQGYTSFYARRDSGLHVRRLADVGRFSTLAVPKQWYSHEFLSDQGLDNLYGVPTPQHMVKMFKHGRIELLVADDLALDDMLAQVGMSRADVELQFTFMHNDSYIAFSNNTDPAVVQRWQQALNTLKRDGNLERIHQHWFARSHEMPSPLAQPSP
ncbi:substrate-binding periplasmic protein [Pseudomonas sp.]|uniref:substrate-binding periplasmic protein n=1 Tax=Pseudomonas sp. TaxID=306 RepID=UPI003C74F8E4